MGKNTIQNLIYFMTHNKTLTRQQQIKRDWLIARDCTPKENSDENTQPKNKEDAANAFCTYHRPAEVSRFLLKFSGDDCLKYTTHVWDTEKITDFESFSKDYYEVVRNDRLWKELYACNQQLYYLIYNYLFYNGKEEKKSNKITHYWSKYNITIGLQNPPGVLSEWLTKNPGKQIFDTPLTEFKGGFSIDQQHIKNKIPVYFNDVVEVFKHCIEFRDSDFYHMIRRVFTHSDIHISSDSLKCLKGITFYTDTELVEQALTNVANNIVSRKENSTEVAIQMIDLENVYELHILHRNSFSRGDIHSKKLMLGIKGTQMRQIRNALQSLCDFYVISRFTDQGKEIDARIDYLYTENAATAPRVTILEEGTSQGFEYVLRFYK